MFTFLFLFSFTFCLYYALYVAMYLVSIFSMSFQCLFNVQSLACNSMRLCILFVGFIMLISLGSRVP